MVWHNGTAIPKPKPAKQRKVCGLIGGKWQSIGKAIIAENGVIVAILDKIPPSGKLKLCKPRPRVGRRKGKT